MHKIPRNLSSNELIKKLKTFDYKTVRQTGSHIRLMTEIQGKKHYITIPYKQSLKVGTLNNII